MLKADCQYKLYADSILYNMDLRAVFIENIKKYRKENKMSQMVLAERCETSTSYIGEIEIGKKFPSIEMVQKIADALDIPPYKLFMAEKDINITALSPEQKQRLIDKLQQSLAEIITKRL